MDYFVFKVYAVPKPKWTQLSNRRLQNWGRKDLEKKLSGEVMGMMCNHSNRFGPQTWSYGRIQTCFVILKKIDERIVKCLW